MNKKQPEAYPWLSVEDALDRVLARIPVLEPETVPILESLGRVLAENVTADMSIPPLDNSAMDGYAVHGADVDKDDPAPYRLRIVGQLAAGYVSADEVVSGTAIRIMTGAPIPKGADTVVRFEDTQLDGDHVLVERRVARGRNVRSAAEDVREGDVVLRQGMVLRPQEIGMMAAVGHSAVRVIRRPRVAILATGDELVDIESPVRPGNIRNSNGYSNAAQVLKYGGIPLPLGIARDRVDELTAKIHGGVNQKADLFVTSGGVSVGDFDMVKDVLASEGRLEFWLVRMKPGKPMAFGEIAGVPLFGLPGNPVSVMVSFELFVRPAIHKMLGMQPKPHRSVQAVLIDGIARKDNRRHYLRVRLTREAGEYRARLTGEQGSGILTSMVRANALAVIPEGTTSWPAGSQVQVLLLE